MAELHRLVILVVSSAQIGLITKVIVSAQAFTNRMFCNVNFAKFYGLTTVFHGEYAILVAVANASSFKGMGMKKLLTSFANIGLIASLSFLSACGGGSEESTTTTVSPIINSITVNVAINGSGQVQTSTGVSCSQTCNVQFTLPTPGQTNAATNLTLTPVAVSGYRFVGWQGACSGTSACTLTFNSNSTSPSVTAVFAPAIVTHTVSFASTPAQGGSIRWQTTGSTTVSAVDAVCPGNCSANLAVGTSITATATAATGYQFAGWEGVCVGSMDDTCNFTVTSALQPTARFTVANQRLVLNVTGEGAITSGLQATPCKTRCQFEVNAGQVVDLVAQADIGSEFTGWSGACTGTAACRITAASSGQQQVDANFRKLAFAVNSENFIELTNPNASVVENYPLQFARPFLPGEIANYPQLVINDQVIATQADVKQRHADGSVKHAIISALVPRIPAGSTMKGYFTNQSSGRNQAKLTKAQMLANAFNFDATIQATFAGSAEKTVSARQLLSQDKFSYWLEGDIATSVLIVDHSVARVGDFGSDNYRSVRPAFFATFWPGLNKVQVRFVGEVANTEAIQDQVYDLVLKGGQNNLELYRKAQLPHQAMTRWTKKYWLDGSNLANVSLNHHLKYLVATKAVPAFDHRLTVPTATIASIYQNWQAQPKDLYQSGWWSPRMGNAGGRSDIGVYPTWSVLWLYSGDWRLAEMAMTHADLTGAWPLHVREGNPNKRFDAARNVDGIGRIISLNAGGRPTAWIPRINWHEIPAADKIEPITALKSTDWQPDVAHHPDFASIQYYLTGDYYYLEQSMFSGNYVGYDNNGMAFQYSYGRGPTGAEGALYSGEERQQAWALRARVHTYAVLPDNFAEKQYFKEKTDNAILLWEGFFNVNTAKAADPLWLHGRNVIAQSQFRAMGGKASPLGMWFVRDSVPETFNDEVLDYKKVASFTRPWMRNMLIISLGRARDLGFATEPLLNFVKPTLTWPAASTSNEQYFLLSYSEPTIERATNNWYQRWTDVRATFQPTELARMQSSYSGPAQDLEHGYDLILLSALAVYGDDPAAKSLRQFFKHRASAPQQLGTNPKWVMFDTQNP